MECDRVSKRKLFFLHMPKTAGTSLIATIKSWFKTDTPVSLEYDRAFLTTQLKSDFVWGHISLDYFSSIPGARRFRKAVVVRDPLQRLASHLQMTDRYNDPDLLERKGLELPSNVTDVFRHVAETDFASPSALDTLMSTVGPWGKIAFHDMQVRFLTDTPHPPTFLPEQRVDADQTQRAMKNLRHFDHILLTEDLDRGVADMANALGKPVPEQAVRTNVGRLGRRVDLKNPDIRAVLEPWVRQDAELYAFAKGEVERRRNRCGLFRWA